jgi:hypothetical protein
MNYWIVHMLHRSNMELTDSDILSMECVLKDITKAFAGVVRVKDDEGITGFRDKNSTSIKSILWKNFKYDSMSDAIWSMSAALVTTEADENLTASLFLLLSKARICVIDATKTDIVYNCDPEKVPTLYGDAYF